MAKGTELVKAEPLSPAELSRLLQEQGFADQPSTNVPRISLKGSMLTTPDGGQYVYNPRKPAEPAMTVRILKPLEEYYAIWIGDDPSKDVNENGQTAAQFLGRPDLKETFSKKFMKNDPERQTWPSDAEFDRLKAGGFKAQWKGDLLVAIAPDSGEFTGNEVPHMLTLSGTSVSEFKGSWKSPEAGYLSEKNFIQKLVAFAIEESGAESKEAAATAVTDALTSYALGGVVAEIRPQIAEDTKKGQSWTVLVFDPIFIQPLDKAPALTEGTDDEDPGL